MVLPARTSSLMGIIVLAGAAYSAAQDAGMPLFNGQNLEGWSHVSSKEDTPIAQVWRVEGGVLVCSGTPAGYLKTAESYENYVLTIDWRWKPGGTGGNSGVLVHCSSPGAIGVWPKSIEVQLAADNAGDFWIIGTELDVPNKEKRKEGRRHLNLVDGAEKPVGQWNTMEITCRGSEIQVKVNGRLVNEATNCSETRGYISLQSEGTEVHFRNIRLRRI